MAIKKTTKKAAKKVAAKKTPAKKAVKASTGSARAKAPAKAAVKKSAAKKAPAKTSGSARGKAAKTTIIANVDVGFGNKLYLRGEGAGLSWDKGTEMKNVSPYEWSFSTTAAKSEVAFKFLINDEAWSEGDNQTVAAGGTSVSSPIFNW